MSTVPIDPEIAPIDGWQARRCALSEGRNESCVNEPAPEDKPALAKEGQKATRRNSASKTNPLSQEDN
jgi:hypothetical protein